MPNLSTGISYNAEGFTYSADNGEPGTGQDANLTGIGVDRTESTQAALLGSGEPGGNFNLVLGEGTGGTNVNIVRDLGNGLFTSITLQPATTVGGTATIGASGPLVVTGGGSGGGALPGGANLVSHTYGDFIANASIGAIDAYSCGVFNQATQSIMLTIPIPPATATPGHVFFVVHNGSASFELNGGAGSIQLIVPGKSYTYVYDGVAWRPAGENATPTIFPNQPTSATISSATLDAFNSLIFTQTTPNVTITLSSPDNPTNGQMLQVINGGTANLLIGPGVVGSNVVFYTLVPGGTFTFVYSTSLAIPRWIPDAGGTLRGGRNAIAGTVTGTTGGSIGSALVTIDQYSLMTVNPGSAGLSYNLNSPSDGADGHLFTLVNISTSFSFNVGVAGGGATVTIPAGGSSQFVYIAGAWYGGAYIPGPVSGSGPIPGGVNMVGNPITDFTGVFAPTAATSVDAFSFAVVNKTSSSGQFTLPSPTATGMGHLYSIANSGTMAFPITSFNGGPVVTLQPQDVMTFYWNGQSSGTGVWLPQGSADSSFVYSDQSSNLTIPAIVTDRYNNLFLFQTVTAGITFTLTALTNGSTNQKLTVHNAGILPIVVGSNFYTGDLYTIAPMSALQFVWSGSIVSAWDPVSPPSLSGGRNLDFKAYANFGTSSVLDVAATSVDVYSHFVIPQTAAAKTVTLPTPTNITAGHVVLVSNTGTAAFGMTGQPSLSNPGLTLPVATVCPNRTYAFYWDGDIWTPQGQTANVNTLLNFSTSVALNDVQFSSYDTLLINQNTTSGINITLPSANTPIDGARLTVFNIGTIIFSIGRGAVGPHSFFYPIAPLTSATFIYSVNSGQWNPDSEGLLRGGRNAYAASLSPTSGATSIGTAPATVDLYSVLLVTPAATGQVYLIPAPSDVTDGHMVTIGNASTTLSFSITSTTQTVVIPPGGVSQFIYVASAWYGGVTTGGGGGSSPLGGGHNILEDDLGSQASITFAQTEVDNFFGVRVIPNAINNTYTIPTPTVTTIGHLFSVTNASSGFTITIAATNVSTLTTIPPGTSAIFWWDLASLTWFPGPIGGYGAHGYNSLAYGPGALSNTSGLGACVAIGSNVLKGCTNNNNTGMGFGCLSSGTSAGDTSAYGNSALTALLAGNQCNAFGSGSLSAATDTTFTSAFGTHAGATQQHGTGCTYLGNNADSVATTATNITCVGYKASGSANGGLFFPGTAVGGVSVLSVPTAPTAMAVLYDTATGQMGPTSSSARFKTNINDLAIDTSAIYQLRPVSYQWKFEYAKHSDPDYIDIGLIAEEVAPLFPQLVPVDKDGLPAGVHYDKIVIVMIAEMKKLRDDIAVLKNKLEETINT